MVLPDGLPHETIRILCCEGGEQGLGRKTLLQFDGLRVGVEFRSLVDVQDANRDRGRGHAGQVDAPGQGHLVLRLHCQHKGAGHLEIDGLYRRW